MRWCCRVALCVACWTSVSSALGQESAAQPQVRVELRWVETKRIEGLTENDGFQSSCDPKSIVYPHQQPALVLTPHEVAAVRLSAHDVLQRGPSNAHYLVTLHLTNEARDKLATTYDGEKMRLLTVVVDGKFWGVRRYEKDKNKPFVPAAARAETFQPDVGFFSSRAEAERLVDALSAKR